MMKKNKRQVNKIYKNLQKNRRAIKIRAYIMAGFLLAVNSFAWFVFATNGNGYINADVISWDISFVYEEEQVETLDISLDDLYPGMETFTKNLIIRNNSDLDATFSYEIQEVTAFGVTYTSEDLINYLANDLPFSLSFQYDKTELDKNESINFSVNVNWPFESSNAYYKLNSLYTYTPGINYYTESDGEYSVADVTDSDFDSFVESGLYVESDDADTYWGEQSIAYKKENPEDSVLKLKVKLIVTQKQ